MADTEEKQVLTEEKQTQTTEEKKKPAKRISKLKLAVIILAACLVTAGVIRLAVYLGSFSHTHLSEDGLTHAIRFQNSVVVHGIDVSQFQDDINWKRVKSSEADFVFIRAGYRKAETGELKEDEEFRENIRKANRAGIMTGAYFFSQAVNEKQTPAPQ